MRNMISYSKGMQDRTSFSLGSNIANIPVANLLFYSALYVWVFFFILSTSFFAVSLGSLIKAIRVACISFLFLGELAGVRITPRYLIGLTVCLVVGVIELGVSQSVMIDTVFFILCSRNHDFRKIAYTCLCSQITAVGLVVLASQIGVLPDYIFGAGTDRVRHYLGFRYALYPSAYVFSITCLFVYLKGSKVHLVDALLLLFVNYITYSLTSSRLSFGISSLAVTLSYVSSFTGTGQRTVRSGWLGKVLSLCFIGAACLSLLLTLLYDRTFVWINALNSDLGARLRFASRAINEYGISLFGSNLKADMVGAGLNKDGVRNAGEYFYVDNLYIRMLVESGVIVFVTYLLGMTAVTSRAIKEQNKALCIVLVCLATHGLMDNLMMNLYYNPFLLLMGTLLVNRKHPKIEDGGMAITIT